MSTVSTFPAYFPVGIRRMGEKLHMWKKLRKKIRQRKVKHARLLAAALCMAVPLLLPTSAAGATLTTPQSFTSGNHTIYDNIILSAAGTALSVDGSNTHVSMSGLSLTTSGILLNPVYGAKAANGGGIRLTDVTIRSTGYARGLHSSGSGSRITMTGGSITSDTKGVETDHGASVILANVAIVAGAGNGLLAFNGSGITMTGGSIVAHDGHDGIQATASGSKITLTNVAVTASRYALTASQGGTIIATVDGQNIRGGQALIKIYSSGDTISLTANNGSQLYGSIDPSTGTANLSLNSGSTWTMPGDSTLTTLALAGGNVAFTAPTTIGSSGSYKTLTVNSSLSGSGAFYLNGNLASGYADTLSLAAGATASGSHMLYVRNWGGTPGDLTKTLKLTSLTGTNTASFSGGSDVGLYRYGVDQGSALSGYTLSGSASDYYLYNTFTPSTPVRAAIAINAGSVVAWYGELNEIKKRLGDLRMGAQSSDDFWVRTYADKFNVKPAGVDSFSQIMRGIEVGKDNPQAFNGGKKYTGFLLGTGKARNTFSSGGEGTSDSTYLGAYASWLRDDGAYVDLIGKYNWFRHSFDTPLMGGGSDSGSYHNNGLGLSAEIGKRFKKGNGVYVEPAAEVAALWSNRASYTTANGLAVEAPSARSLQLRLGCTVGRKWQGPDKATRQMYGKVSWVNEFAGDSTVRVDTASFDSSLKGHQWVTGIGYIEDGKRYQLYLDVEKSWGTTVSKTWGFNAGYRWKF